MCEYNTDFFLLHPVVYLVTTRLKLSTVLLRAGVERLLVGSESRTALAVGTDCWWQGPSPSPRLSHSTKE